MTCRPSRLVMSGSGRGVWCAAGRFLGEGKRGLGGERVGLAVRTVAAVGAVELIKVADDAGWMDSWPWYWDAGAALSMGEGKSERRS